MVATRVEAFDGGYNRESLWLICEDVVNFVIGDTIGFFLLRVLRTIFPTCGHMPLTALSLWPGRQQCRPRLVDGRRGGGP